LPFDRRLCGKLYLKAETQQVDRILEQFSRRYWDCNPECLYGSTSELLHLLLGCKFLICLKDIVHAVSYSLLLLNTDLHVAELSARMSRSQFVRNTMTAIQTQFQPNSPARLSTSDLTYDDCSSSIRGSEDTEVMSRSKRSDSIASFGSHTSLPVSPAPRSGSSTGAEPSNGNHSTSNVNEQQTPYRPQHGRAWESDMESLLKVISHYSPFY